jgi:exodeoxyribonuclease-3
VKPTADDLGVAIDVGGGRLVYVFSVNLDDAPYQPYQLLNIEYGNSPFLKTADEAIKSAEETRGKSFDALIADATAATDAAAVFIAGDFNEPSHRDWTDAAVKAGLQPLAVAWPGTTKLEAAGFTDAFRAVHPDPVAKPGITWTPTTEASDPEDHHDRIDFVFARGAGLKVLSAEVVGEKAPEAGIVVTPWPSDHRAVVTKVEF